MRSEQFLTEIRTAEGLPRAVLQKIVVEGRTATFYLLTDVIYSDKDRSHAEWVGSRYVPEGFEAKVRIAKSVPDEEGVRRKILDFMRNRFPAAAAFISPTDVEIICDKQGGRFFIGIGPAERAQFSSGEVLNAVSAELCKCFCGTWFGNVRTVEKEAVSLEQAELPPMEEAFAPRFFPVCNYLPIDNAKPKTAMYIADLDGEIEGVTVCGKITFLQEKETSKQKPYFSVSLTDGSGSMRINYFTKKATLEKIRGLKVGDEICVTGSQELYNGSLSFRAKAIDYGTPPEGFVPEQRPSRAVPAVYKTVFPEPTSDLRQAALFDEVPLPESFKSKRFVVFDLETTGFNNSPVSGTMDHIIEVGAVKIEDGKICEKFSSFVACPVKLSQEIKTLTGIEDEDLVGAPSISEIVPDFFKFCDGCILVGHNVNFDCKFIRYYGEKDGYLFNHNTYDTWTLAQEVLRLPNYKLNTIADHYGFTFSHHRAYEDAFVTAKVLLELVKEKKGL